MKKNLLASCLYLVLAAAAVPVHAQDNAPATNWSLGLAAVSGNSPYRGYDEKIWPIPAVNYDSSQYYLQGLSAGFYLVKNQAYDLSIDASIATNYFDPSDTTNTQLKKLKTRDPSLMAGLRFRHRADWGLVQVNVAHDVGSNAGQNAQFEYGYPITGSKLSLTPSVGESWDSSKFNAYYYGISYNDAARSSLAAYRPGASWSPYAKVTATYQITLRWSAFAQVRYTRFADQISNSPMVDSKGVASYLVGALYHF